MSGKIEREGSGGEDPWESRGPWGAQAPNSPQKIGWRERYELNLGGWGEGSADLTEGTYSAMKDRL